MPRVYVHGLGQTPGSWDKVRAQLGGQDGLCPSLPGLLHGHEATYANLCAGFTDVCDHAGGPLDICGLSLGAVLALDYAIHRPKNVRSLALIAAQYKSPQRLLKLQDIIFRFMPAAMFNEMGFGKKDFMTLCRSMMELDFSSSLQGAACPVLVVCGEKDTANRAASERLAELLPDARLHILSGVGHEANTQAPEQLAAALRGFGWAAEVE